MPEIHDPGTYIKLYNTDDQSFQDDWSTGPDDYMLYYEHDNEEPKVTSGGESRPLLSKGHWDAVVDSSFNAPFSDTYLTIQSAIDGDPPNDFYGVARTIESIFVRNAGDTAAITIASSDNVQRIVGKDADTVTVPVNITCNKDDVTFEQLKFSSNNLTINGASAGRNTIQQVLLDGSSVLTIDGGAHLVEGSRFRGSSVTPVVLVDAGASRIQGNLFDLITGTNCIEINPTTALGDLVISDNEFQCAGNTPSDYVVECIAAENLNSPVIRDNQFLNIDEGGADLVGVRMQIIGNVFRASSGMTATKRALRVKSPAGQDIDSLVASNIFQSNNVTNVMFECISADADAAGLVFANNVSAAGSGGAMGVFHGAQDMMWIGNQLAGATINFQSKTGQVVIGGDMTGCTLQNVPSDIVFRNVKGQDDRGHYIPVDASVDLGSSSKRFRDGWFSRNLSVDDASSFGNNAAAPADAVGMRLQHDWTDSAGFGRWAAIIEGRRSGTGSGTANFTGALIDALYTGTSGGRSNPIALYARSRWNSASNGSTERLEAINAEIRLEAAGDVLNAHIMRILTGGGGAGRVTGELVGARVDDLTGKADAAADVDVVGVWVIRQDDNTTPTDRWLLLCGEGPNLSAGVGQAGIREVGINGLVINFPVYSDATRPTAGAAGEGGVIYNSDDKGLNVSDGSNWRVPDGSATT